MNVNETALPSWQSANRLCSDRMVLAAFTGTLLMSALLMFSVQPVFAKMVLPKLGGSSSVWAISMCFFQGVLLLGYCYAHAINRWVPWRRAPAVHAALLLAAFMALPFGLPADIEPPAGDAYLWLTGLLAVGVGLPFFAISATAPLLQSWFSRTGHPHANDPYFLYGASNLGSLTALLAYPFAIEPFLGLSVQAHIWTFGFVLLVLLIATSGLMMLSVRATATTDTVPQRSLAKAVTWTDRLGWSGLAFVPSALLVAYTSYVTTDVASAPLIWVLPLAVFLATFILVFREKSAISMSVLTQLQPFAIAMTLTGLSVQGSSGWLAATLGGFAAFFISTMTAHRELYERRPEPQQLTEFYMWMSFGGVLGGIFAAIVSPQIFNALYELPLVLALCLFCRQGIREAFADTAHRFQNLRNSLISAAILLLVAGVIWVAAPSLRGNAYIGLIAMLAFAALMILSPDKPLKQACHGLSASIAMIVLPTAMNLGDPERSFYGVHRVMLDSKPEADGKSNVTVRVLVHGTTTHGTEQITDTRGIPLTARPTPTTYYHAASPIARALELARGSTAATRQGAFKAGIVGLGAGSMACYAQPGDAWRFYEIDPLVARIAATKFSFLPRCLPGADIVLGDARLTLAKDTGASFDYLLIDAFSSDSIPVHLLTREALQLYLDKLHPDGILAMHISNRHLELQSVVAALVASIDGISALHVLDVPKGSQLNSASRVMIIAKSKEALAPALAWKGATLPDAAGTAVWTDDYSDVLSALWRVHGWKK